ncbi:MAG: chromosome segregation protein SMC [Oscillospiraceae bacterium]
MYLKALEIQGFKSFPEKTTLSFEKDITAIVGPNGSGKSNISDAILWVMGEQRSRALRGGKMEDVIFGGTEKRNAMGFAQVSLILENSTRLLNLDSSEVMITRRYYRSGESEYYINREPVRLRDINELLMDTGLGRDGYSIIGQGRIAEIISAKSTDRREIFEAAAGISRYRYRKEEAERKLVKTDENLLRVNDKIDELALQVTPLKKQAEDAKNYLRLRDELKQAEVSVWLETLDRLRAQAQTTEADFASAGKARDEAKQEMDKFYADAENFSEKMREKDIETESTRELLGQTEAMAGECESAMAVLRTNLENNSQSIQRIMSDLQEQEARANELGGQIADHERRLLSIEEEKGKRAAEMQTLNDAIRENETSNDESERALSQLIARENAVGDALTHSRTVVTMLADSAQELMDRETACAQETAAAESRRTEACSQLGADKKRLCEAEEKLSGLNNVISGYRLRVQGREAKVRELGDQHTKLTIDCRSVESRITMLAEMEKEFEGFSKAVKTVMREAERGTLRGVHGPVASLLRADERYALAIETAIGGAMQNIVVDTPEVGKAAIEMLKTRDAGRGTFLPVSAIRGSTMARLPDNAPGYLGLAIELVSFDPQYRGIFENLLGRTVVTETLGDAVSIARKFNNKFRIVSLDGQLINAGGSMTGGSTARGTGILSRANELKRLRERIVGMKDRLHDCETELNEANRELSAAKYEMTVAQEEQSAAQAEHGRINSAVEQGKLLLKTIDESLDALDEEKRAVAQKLRDNRDRTAETQKKCEQLQTELETLREQSASLSCGRETFETRRRALEEDRAKLREATASLDAEAETTRRTIAQMTELRDNLRGASGGRAETIAGIEAKSADLKLELEARERRLTEINTKIASLKQRISDCIAMRMTLEGKRVGAEKAGKDKNNALIDLERLCAKIEQKKLAAEMEEKQIVDKLWDSYELSHTAAQNMRRAIENMPAAQKRIGELKRAISALGNPNLGAIDEYARVSERYDFLTEQRDDVEKAKRELQAIISDITKEMKEIFTHEFNAIGESFRQTFLELFGGGRAALILEDEANVLDCGIEIRVQPPGKALSTISLLSGGEKAFVAIALYFAIMKVRPTPFCVMDEIEAALDDANVIRFAEYMRNFTNKTQFLVITHRRGTMEQADILYGVTMQEKGVSKVIEMDVDEAEKTLA